MIVGVIVIIIEHIEVLRIIIIIIIFYFLIRHVCIAPRYLFLFLFCFWATAVVLHQVAYSSSIVIATSV